jgi:hypothetical protein
MALLYSIEWQAIHGNYWSCYANRPAEQIIENRNMTYCYD